MSKGGEMLGNLNVKTHGNQQPSPLNTLRVSGKVQRLTGEDVTNKPDTSAAPEKDDIVRAV